MIHMAACSISLSVNTNRIQNSVVMQKRDPIQNFDMHLLLTFMLFEKLQSSKSVISQHMSGCISQHMSAYQPTYKCI